MRVTDVRVLLRETDPASPTRYAAFPSLLKCPDGTILLAERAGSGKNTADGTFRLWRSGDGGRSWEQQPRPFASTPAGKPGELRTAELSLIDPDRIAMLVTWIDHPQGDPPLANPRTEGILPIYIAWTDSRDSGRTWAPLRPIPVAPLVQSCGNGGIIRLPGRSLLAGFEVYKHYDDPSPWSSRSAIVISRDDGRSWQPPQVLADDPERNICYWDHHITPLRPGALLDVLWSDDRRKPGVSQIMSMVSRDGGASWTRPEPVGIAGQYSFVLELSDGRLLLFYVMRAGDDPSIRVRVGRQERDGIHWEEGDAMVLYSNRQDDLRDASKKGFTDYLVSMGTWSFGWPSAIELRPGQVLASYYRVEGEFSSVRLAQIET